MDQKEELFHILDELEKYQPISKEKSSQVLQVSFSNADRQNNPYFSIKIADPSSISKQSPFEYIEHRIPNSTKRGGILILDLKAEVDVKDEDILKRYNKVSFHPASPMAPESEPNYIRVIREWGKLSFGVSRDEKKKVVGVVLDTMD